MKASYQVTDSLSISDVKWKKSFKENQSGSTQFYKQLQTKDGSRKFTGLVPITFREFNAPAPVDAMDFEMYVRPQIATQIKPKPTVPMDAGDLVCYIDNGYKRYRTVKSIAQYGSNERVFFLDDSWMWKHNLMLVCKAEARYDDTEVLESGVSY